MMRDQWQAFLHAVHSFTRIPVTIEYDEKRFQSAATYFPLVGWLVGGAGAATYVVAAEFLPGTVAVALSMIATILLTGAFHEDGLADVCDGFGGGYTPERVLEIMKDSRVGTYGAVGLFSVLGTKWLVLTSVPETLVPTLLIAGHAISRAAATSLIATCRYARVDAESKSKPLVTKLSPLGFAVALAFGLAPLACRLSFWWAVIPVALTTLYLARWFQRRIGGYTGDCLGATQQITELVFLIAVLAS